MQQQETNEEGLALAREFRIEVDLLQYGWSNIAGNSAHPCAYTIGLHERFNHPEIIVFGLSDEQSRNLLNQVGVRVSSGQKMTTNTHYRGIFEGGLDVVLKYVPPVTGRRYAPRAYGRAELKTRRQISLYQAVWPDKNNLFPWQEGYDEKMQTIQYLICEP
jgi:hypothetical protein